MSGGSDNPEAPGHAEQVQGDVTPAAGAGAESEPDEPLGPGSGERKFGFRPGGDERALAAEPQRGAAAGDQ